MTAAEITEWQAYERETGPLGAERDDILAAMTAYYVTTALGAKKLKLDRLIPKWAPKRPEGWQSIKGKLMALAKAAGGEVVTRD